MKLAFLSDFHLGFSQPGRENEAFENALSALKAAVAEEPDAIVFTGDFFHKDVPEQKTLLEAFRLLNVPHSAKGSGMEVEKESKQGKEKLEMQGIPVIAIHGTHEFRGKDFANVLQVLESAGFIVYLHAERVSLSKHRETVVLHGLGGVPEKKARDALKLWAPKPVTGAFNILLLHQSFKEFLPFDDEMVVTLSIADLPKGFGLYVNGHLHWNSEFDEKGTHFLVPGSTVITQMKRLEAKKEKGYCLFGTKEGKAEFRAFPGQRAFHYSKVKLSEASAEEVKEAAEAEIKKLLEGTAGAKPPLVKVKLEGTLAKGFSPSDLNLRGLEQAYKGKAVVSISADFREESFRKKIAALSREQAQKKSITELGLEILEKNLEETDFKNSFDARRVFELLKNNELEKASELIASAKTRKGE